MTLGFVFFCLFYLSSFGSFTAPTVNMYCYYSFFLCGDIEHCGYYGSFHTLSFYIIFRLQLLIYCTKRRRSSSRYMADGHWGVNFHTHVCDTNVRELYCTIYMYTLDTARYEVHIHSLLLLIIIISPFAIFCVINFFFVVDNCRAYIYI